MGRCTSYSSPDSSISIYMEQCTKRGLLETSDNIYMEQWIHSALQSNVSVFTWTSVDKSTLQIPVSVFTWNNVYNSVLLIAVSIFTWTVRISHTSRSQCQYLHGAVWAFKTHSGLISYMKQCKYSSSPDSDVSIYTEPYTKQGTLEGGINIYMEQCT